MSKVTMMLMNENTAADKECLFWMMTTTTACGSANMKKTCLSKKMRGWITTATVTATILSDTCLHNGVK